jgi:hypothetical protein
MLTGGEMRNEDPIPHGYSVYDPLAKPERPKRPRDPRFPRKKPKPIRRNPLIKDRD